MRFYSALWAISRNTVQEVFRQPVYGILLAIGMAVIAFSPTISMFTMMEDVKLVIDMGLASIFLMGIILAVFAASRVINREIDSKTVATIMSKPVGRFTFLLGKFLGLLIAILCAEYLLSLMLVMTVRMGVPEAATYEVDWPVFWAQFAPAVLAALFGAYKNYFYRAPFASTAVFSAVPLYSVAFLFLFILGPKWKYDWFAKTLVSVHAVPVAKAALLVFLGVTVLMGLALAVSTRVNIVTNVIICGSVFFLGMVSYYLFGQFADHNWLARAAYTAIPNLQTFWVAEGFVQENPQVPWYYIRTAFLYALCFNAAFLMLAAFLFEERELV